LRWKTNGIIAARESLDAESSKRNALESRAALQFEAGQPPKT
jgi:hypothetical protein